MADRPRSDDRRRLGGSTYDMDPIRPAERDRWRQASYHPPGPEPAFGNEATPGHEIIPSVTISSAGRS